MQQANKDLYFRSDKANADKLYHINELKIVLGEELCSQLLFLHAYTGCDTTSRIFGVGKKSVFHKLVKGNAILKDCQFLPSSKADCSIHCEQMLSSDGCDFWGHAYGFPLVIALQCARKKSSLFPILRDTRTPTAYRVIKQISLPKGLLPNNGPARTGE